MIYGMKELTLREYVDQTSQTEAAALIGRTQGAVWQMLRDERDIRLIFDDKGNFIKPYEISDLREPGVHPKRTQKRPVKRAREK